MFDALKRDSSWTMIKPGLWIDPAGFGHIFPDEVLANLQFLHPDADFHYSESDYNLVVETFVSMMRAVHPQIEIRHVHHERERAS